MCVCVRMRTLLCYTSICCRDHTKPNRAVTFERSKQVCVCPLLVSLCASYSLTAELSLAGMISHCHNTLHYQGIALMMHVVEVVMVMYDDADDGGGGDGGGGDGGGGGSKGVCLCM